MPGALSRRVRHVFLAGNKSNRRVLLFVWWRMASGCFPPKWPLPTTFPHENVIQVRGDVYLYLGHLGVAAVRSYARSFIRRISSIIYNRARGAARHDKLLFSARTRKMVHSPSVFIFVKIPPPQWHGAGTTATNAVPTRLAKCSRMIRMRVNKDPVNTQLTL